MAEKPRWPDPWAMGADENNHVIVYTHEEYLQRVAQRNREEREDQPPPEAQS